jgi:O-antigen ligase
MEFYKNSLLAIKNNILFGNGTGSFGHEYELIAKQQNAITTNATNPHNQFLFTTEELGITGLFILSLFFYIPWHISYNLKDQFHKQAVRGLIITLTIGSLFNSLLFDTSEGKFYCILIAVLLSTYKKPNTSHLIF